MDADEREIVDYLSTFGEQWVNSKEICRRAGGKRRFNDDNHWAIPVLQRLKDNQVLEADMRARYRIKPPPKHGHDHAVSPDTQKLLDEGGMPAEIEDTGEAED